MIRTLILLLFTGTLVAQLQYDTVINTGIYRSYFSKKLKQPVAVVYKLYHGGGSASRSNDEFAGIAGLTLTDQDYSGSGFDRGHLVPAEDFAYSDSLQAITFRYDNCVPQCPKLNRGKWKKYENKVRQLSQKDTVVVVCYNQYDGKKAGSLSVPKFCYKAVFDRRGKVLLSVGFENSAVDKEVKSNSQIWRKIYAFELTLMERSKP